MIGNWPKCFDEAAVIAGPRTDVYLGISKPVIVVVTGPGTVQAD